MSATATTSKQPASTPALECRQFPFHTVYEGSAQQLVAFGVLPDGYKFPARGKDHKFIAGNGFEYTVDRDWHTPIYTVFVGIPDSALFPAQVLAVIKGIHRLFLSLPGEPLQLVNVQRGDSDKIENLRLTITGPRVSRGTVFYSLASVMELYAQEEILASGTVKSPAGYLHSLPSPIAAPAARPALRRALPRLLAAA